METVDADSRVVHFNASASVLKHPSIAELYQLDEHCNRRKSLRGPVRWSSCTATKYININAPESKNIPQPKRWLYCTTRTDIVWLEHRSFHPDCRHLAGAPGLLLPPGAPGCIQSGWTRWRTGRYPHIPFRVQPAPTGTQPMGNKQKRREQRCRSNEVSDGMCSKLYLVTVSEAAIQYLYAPQEQTCSRCSRCCVSGSGDPLTVSNRHVHKYGRLLVSHASQIGTTPSTNLKSGSSGGCSTQVAPTEQPASDIMTVTPCQLGSVL